MTGPFARDSVPSIPFTSTAERDAAEASGQFAPGVTWVRFNDGTIEEAGYVDLAGAFVSTAGGGATEVASWAALLALPAPSEGQQARVTDADTFGDYTYSASLGGDATNQWLPSDIYARLNDWTRVPAGTVATRILSTSGGGSDVAFDFQISQTGLNGFFTNFPDGDVTDVGGDIQFVSSAGAKVVGMFSLVGSPFAFGDDLFVVSEINQTLAGDATGLNTRLEIDPGQGKQAQITRNWGGTSQRCGFTSDAGVAIAEGGVDITTFDTVFTQLNHVDSGGVDAPTSANGFASLSKTWSPAVATPARGGIRSAAELAVVTSNFLPSFSGSSNISVRAHGAAGNTFLIRKLFAFRLN